MTYFNRMFIKFSLFFCSSASRWFIVPHGHLVLAQTCLLHYFLIITEFLFVNFCHQIRFENVDAKNIQCQRKVNLIKSMQKRSKVKVRNYDSNYSKLFLPFKPEKFDHFLVKWRIKHAAYPCHKVLIWTILLRQQSF